jgi:Domain of unknown function (DUF4232)
VRLGDAGVGSQRPGAVQRPRRWSCLYLAAGGAMRRTVEAAAAAILVAVVAGGCGSSTGTVHRCRRAEAGIPRCSAPTIVLRPGTFVVPMTGEHAVMYALTNRGAVTCALSGYPKVVLYDAGVAALPFRYVRGGGAYVTSRKPVTVVLARGASAYVLVAKYRCNLGVARNAAAIRLTLPGAHGAASTGREAVATAGAAGLSYCRGGQFDPGQVIAVSPVEPTQEATRNLR